MDIGYEPVCDAVDYAFGSARPRRRVASHGPLRALLGLRRPRRDRTALPGSGSSERRRRAARGAAHAARTRRTACAATSSAASGCIAKPRRSRARAARAGIRIDLEQGRLRRSSGDPRSGASAVRVARSTNAKDAGELFLAADAAHMAALAAADREERLRRVDEARHRARGVRTTAARYWLGPLLNNLGWEHYEAGEHEPALAAFEQALDAPRARSGEHARRSRFARYAVAKAQQALGRHAEAVAQLELAVASTEAEGTPDGWYHEALAESDAALGREDRRQRNAELRARAAARGRPVVRRRRRARGRLRELAGARSWIGPRFALRRSR